jgi:hypothetical protein
LDSITFPKGSQHQILACCPCRLRMPVPDAAILGRAKPENNPLSLIEWMEDRDACCPT